jgi:hypothetical protein
MPNTKTLPTFSGRTIATEIIKAVEAIPEGCEIVTLSAGENMLIRCAYLADDNGDGWIPEYAWDGQSWREIGYL